METFSEETLAKARTAKIYIEHLYKVQSQNVKERRDRWAPHRRLWCSRHARGQQCLTVSLCSPSRMPCDSTGADPARDFG